MKRACDRCIDRKVRCDGSLPCARCSSKPELSCTYLTPPRKRGPKFSRLRRPRSSLHIHQISLAQCTERDGRSRLVDYHDVGNYADSSVLPLRTKDHDLRIPFSVLETIIEAYEARMFPVWPVIGSKSLLQQLQQPGDSIDTYVVATALCAATMAQLNLPSTKHQSRAFASEDMERECRRMRATSEYREQPHRKAVLASFFLHVYHAKVDNQNSALLYIQEAIALARLLHLDDNDGPCGEYSSDELTNGKVIYLLLWVTERGYAIQYGLPISLHHTVSLSSMQKSPSGTCIQGLIGLASLFVTFDSSSIPQFSRYKEFPVSKDRLVALEERVANAPAPLRHLSVAQQADFLATKSWMQILLWQQAMSRGFLSSSSDCGFMTFRYPAQVARESLSRIQLFSTKDLMPLGRDQLVKLFEVANTLADTLLCSTQFLKRSSSQLGPPDILHGIYQYISPMLELDGVCDSMLRQKTAEVLVRAPTRFWQLESGTMIEKAVDDGNEIIAQR